MVDLVACDYCGEKTSIHWHIEATQLARRNSRGVWIGKASSFTWRQTTDGTAAPDPTPSSPEVPEALTQGNAA